jgi:hypothetical protein
MGLLVEQLIESILSKCRLMAGVRGVVIDSYRTPRSPMI